MFSPGPSGEFSSTRDENGQTWRGRGKQMVQDCSPDNSCVDSVFDYADGHLAEAEPGKQPTSQCGNAFAQDGQVESEDEELSKAKCASDDIVSYEIRSPLRERRDSTASTKIPTTPMSRPVTPHTSRPVTPHTSRPATPYTSRPASLHSSASNTLNTSTPATPHTSGPRKLDHLPQTPHIPKSKPSAQQLSSPPSPKPTSLTPLPSNPHKAKHPVPRHMRSTPQLQPPKKNTHLTPTSSLPSPPYTTPPPRPYTFPPRRFLKNTTAYRKPGTTRVPTRRHAHPSVCTHVDLSLHCDQRSIIEGGTRYRCRCKPSTLRSRASNFEFQWIDGAAQLFYPDAPGGKAEWCYCSNGEGHIVRSASEAIDQSVAEPETVLRLVPKGKGRSSDARLDELEAVSKVVPKGKGHLSDAQLEQLEAAEWGGTETALRKQRDCLWLRGRVSKLKCFSWTRRSVRKES
jgi:hypothetical protein